MEKEKLNAYAARVSQANRSELVVIMYEAFLDSVKEGDAQMKQGDMPACRREIERFAHATHVMERLLPSFREVAKQDTSEAVMKNVQQIYAGLTYGRGSLNETIGDDIGKNRGFEA